MQVCRQCHPDKYETFVHTGMGMSFDTATLRKTSADFSGKLHVSDTCLNLKYRAEWKEKHLFVHEMQFNGKDTLFKRTQMADYIIGSGQHTNSHLYRVNGYLYQMPMTFYTQKHTWDLPPGFENCNNSRFSRKIGLECLTCHNSFPEMVKGSENKYTAIPDGISCERCHGPGGAHVAAKRRGEWVDTSKYIDYTIVNPAKLSIDRQFDVCQRCHLQGTAVLENGKSFFDFKPGMKLHEYISVYLPRYSHADDEFIMASHADRLKQSKCMLVSNRKADPRALRPYRNGLTCVNCHNPHVSVRTTNKEVFNEACKKCHTTQACSEKPAELAKASGNCVSCHMPVSGSLDIPHVTVHDHKIGIHRKKNETSVAGIKKFMGLFSVNHPAPGADSRAKAYLQYAEKVDGRVDILDSAGFYIDRIRDPSLKADLSIQEAFLRGDYGRVLSVYMRNKDLTVFHETRMSYDNHLAWMHYRIGDAAMNRGDYVMAERELAVCNNLAPFVPDFINKWGSAALASGDLQKAELLFRRAVSEDSLYAPGWCNLGFIFLQKRKWAEAERFLLRACRLQPGYQTALQNLSIIHGEQGEHKVSKRYKNH